MTDTIKLKTYEATFTEKEVEIPTSCPNCSHEFIDEGDEHEAIVETVWEPWQYLKELRPDETGEMNLHTIESFADPDEDLFNYPTAMRCANCDWKLA